jgi:hypothetical protein
VEMVEKLNTLYDDKGLFRFFSMKQDFPDAWHLLLKGPINPQNTQFEIKENFFPYMFAGKDLEMTEVKIFLIPKKDQVINTAGLMLAVNGEVPAGAWSNFKQTEIKSATYDSLTDNPVKSWMIDAGNNGLKKDEIDDLLILVRYIIL